MDPISFIVIISVLGPVIGSAIGVIRQPSFGYICNMLCFAAGVMLAISFLELIPEGIHLASVPVCVAGIICGALVMNGLDRLIPHIHPPALRPRAGLQPGTNLCLPHPGDLSPQLPRGHGHCRGVGH